MSLSKTVKRQLSTHDTDVKALLDTIDKILDGTSTDVTTILSRIGTPAGASVSADIAVINGYVDEVESLLKNVTYGLSALNTAIGLRATPAQVLTHVQTEVGSYSGQTNLKTLLAVLGIPDTVAKPLYTCLITDRLDSNTYGLNALLTAIGTRLATAGYTAPDNADIVLVKTQTDKLPNVEFTTPYSSGVQYDDIAAVGPTLTTAVSITPTYPVGATKVRAIVVVDLFIMNDSANGQKVTPILQVQLAAGGFNNVWTPGADIVAVPATDGTSAFVRAVVDISAYVATATATTIKWSITQTSANSVHYTSQATIFLVCTV